MTANEKQVGGAHYKSVFQHWDWAHFVDLAYMPAQVSKYLFRWRKKNGVEDVEKSHHFLLKYIEQELAAHTANVEMTADFIRENEIPDAEAAVIMALVRYKQGNVDTLRHAAVEVQRIIDQAKATIVS